MDANRIEIGTPAMLFPAVSILMLAYTNRFLALARIVRDLTSQKDVQDKVSFQRQISGLEHRFVLIKWTQALGILALLSCLVSMFLLFIDQRQIGESFFGLSVTLLFASLCVCLREVMLAGNALRVVLEAHRDNLKRSETKEG